MGSYQCGCRNGYETFTTYDRDLKMDIPSCSDIDECTSQGLCPDNSVCLNTPGNYTCECNKGFEGHLCTDIDECMINATCHGDAECSNNEGSYDCSCKVGYHGNGKVCRKGQCDDRSCPTNQKCVSPSTLTCQCKKGFRFEKVKDSCQDINECLLGGYCSQNSSCVNSEGSSSCSCNPGYFGDGKICRKGNCTEDLCSVNEECVSPMTLDCRCKPGFERNGTGFCIDTDECSNNKNNCDAAATCSNEIGAYTCFCNSGFYGNGYSCEDINECEKGLHDCHADATCVNTMGNFTCRCNKGFSCRNRWILVVNSWQRSVSLMIDGRGESKEVKFELGDTVQVSDSCSITWQGKMYVFGGSHQARQIAVVGKCKLKSKGKLPFEMIAGACAQRNNAEVFICFENINDFETHRNCHRATDPLMKGFSKLPKSTHYHQYISIAVTKGKLSGHIKE